MEVEGELLEPGEQIGGEVVNHPLTEADVGVGMDQTDRPTAKEGQDGRSHAPADEAGVGMRSGQHVRQARQHRRSRLFPENVIHQKNHRPRLEHIEGDADEHGEHDAFSHRIARMR